MGNTARTESRWGRGGTDSMGTYSRARGTVESRRPWLAHSTRCRSTTTQRCYWFPNQSKEMSTRYVLYAAGKGHSPASLASQRIQFATRFTTILGCHDTIGSPGWPPRYCTHRLSPRRPGHQRLTVCRLPIGLAASCAPRLLLGKAVPSTYSYILPNEH